MPNETIAPQLLTVSQVAANLSLKEGTVRSWLFSRRIAYVRIGKRAIRIPSSEIQRILSEGEVPARRPINAAHVARGAAA